MRAHRRRRLRRTSDAVTVSIVRLAALAAIVVGVYALVVLGIGAVPSSGQWTLLAFSALAAAACALIYARIRAPVGDWARAILTRRGAASDDVVRVFAHRAASGLPLDELLAALLETLRTGLSASRAEIWLRSGETLELSAADPPRAAAPLALGAMDESAAARAGVVGRRWLALWLPGTLVDRNDDVDVRASPITHAGELIGIVIVERDAQSPPFGQEAEEAVAMLSRQAALALRNVRLGSALDASMEELRRQAEALRQSRMRVVTAADAERRRIERDLHDGAQQHLLGLAVNLKVARELRASDPDRAEGILAELSDELHSALEDLRELAHGIYPPLLAERGLADAIRVVQARSACPGGVETNGLARYPADVEATVYFCCAEAIQNAAKHGAGRVSVRLWVEGDALLFEVSDAGPGFDPATTPEGAGITNMRDRVGALGGTLRLDARPGAGTQVTGAVPTAPPGTRARP